MSFRAPFLDHIVVHFVTVHKRYLDRTESEVSLFAYDCVCCRGIKDKENTLKLQREILIDWDVVPGNGV